MPTKAVVSEEEYLRTSYSGVDREFRDGEVLERSVPNFFHGELQLALAGFFRPFRKSKNLHPTVETRIRLRPGHYAIPDVSVFWPNRPATGIPKEMPLIAIEILFPDDRMSEVVAKLSEYRERGVPHVWLADPERGAFYVYSDGLHQVDSIRIPEVDLEFRFANLLD